MRSKPVKLADIKKTSNSSAGAFKEQYTADERPASAEILVPGAVGLERVVVARDLDHLALIARDCGSI